jgi:NAD(P)-dependent dehydrogenase (short-subunit alcohol dehydrogenase family)
LSKEHQVANEDDGARAAEVETGRWGLRGKRVLVTGGGSGIGAATAKLFIAEGARVCILDSNTSACERMKDDHIDLAGFVIADVADRAQVEDGFRRVLVQIDGVDILINNAGVSVRHEFLHITPHEWERVIGVNLTGAFNVAQLVARHMMEHDGGVILNTASTNGIMGYPLYADYNASKAGLISLTKSMALELAPKVRVNAVAPGYVMTPMQRREYTDQMLAAVNSKIPMGRHATPQEIAGLFAFLASDQAEYITGQVITIDGGEIAGGLASR